MKLWQSSHGRGKSQNGSKVHPVNQDGWLELLAYMKQRPFLKTRRVLVTIAWAVGIGLAISLSCHAAWYERQLELKLATMQEEIDASKREKQEFLHHERP